MKATSTFADKAVRSLYSLRSICSGNINLENAYIPN